MLHQSFGANECHNLTQKYVSHLLSQVKTFKIKKAKNKFQKRHMYIMLYTYNNNNVKSLYAEWFVF